MRQNLRIDQVVVEHDVGPRQRLAAAQRDQARIARSAADQIHFADVVESCACSAPLGTPQTVRCFDRRRRVKLRIGGCARRMPYYRPVSRPQKG